MIKAGSKVKYADIIYTVIRKDGNAYIVKRAGANAEITIPIQGTTEIIVEGRADIKGQKLNG